MVTSYDYGLKIFIDNSSSVLSTFSEGILVQTASNLEISLHKVMTERLPYRFVLIYLSFKKILTKFFKFKLKDGHLGLFLGISILSFKEVIEIILDSIAIIKKHTNRISTLKA
jgi:hypothetical protein